MHALVKFVALSEALIIGRILYHFRIANLHIAVNIIFVKYMNKIFDIFDLNFSNKLDNAMQHN